MKYPGGKIEIRGMGVGLYTIKRGIKSGGGKRENKETDNPTLGSLQEEIGVQ